MKNNSYEFYVRVNDKNIKEYIHNGKTYIEGRKNTEYVLYFKNNTHNKLKVIFSVDGLSVVDGQQASDKSRGYIIPGYQSITIPGWTINDSTVAKFEFRPQGDKENITYLETLKQEGVDVDIFNQGIIGAMVFKEKYQLPKINEIHRYYHNDYWTPGIPIYPYPYPYNIFESRGICASPYQGYASVLDSNIVNCNTQQSFNCFETSLGTGFGEDKIFETTTMYFESESVPDFTFVLEYDTIINLKRRGVIVIDQHMMKQAFPGYSQEYCKIPKNRG